MTDRRISQGPASAVLLACGHGQVVLAQSPIRRQRMGLVGGSKACVAPPPLQSDTQGAEAQLEGNADKCAQNEMVAVIFSAHVCVVLM